LLEKIKIENKLNTIEETRLKIIEEYKENKLKSKNNK
jgi:hypothetical protein